ncbi:MULTISPECIES: HK97 gp10 family phage protein [unclassified Gilliamella]|uniref:HK97 gp10 family phage protein n=1 Tax=unclassified Gilliamella TaxID=2685620 RepID=UPI002269B49E|nr:MULTISPECIES: HK97 gp10 family phage protein [unclassified Gilliamella]MCX8597660.1 HK97 gp10 family phage protein [Gilliamella sp. B3493]MCX8599110.1 HK97 gp10 family phage protein [Gilliamella sp. B3486]MCX8688880.1 HK97 gp10 family phage protein [Gilliamella sp. B2973]MCX8704584.1 HK97 gp10 family phage protein [Gilliamella sp. B3127]
MTVKGVSKVNKNIHRITNDIANIRTQRIIQQVMIVGMSFVAPITPRDTSTLINSQYRELKPVPKGWIGRVGYTANYAAFVNNAKGTAKGKRTGKKSQGDYWSPNAEPHFVEKGFERDGQQAIEQVIKDGYKI